MPIVPKVMTSSLEPNFKLLFSANLFGRNIHFTSAF